MAIVRKGGEVSAGDAVVVSLPEMPHTALPRL
jgi:hypothetical protein